MKAYNTLLKHGVNERRISKHYLINLKKLIENQYSCWIEFPDKPLLVCNDCVLRRSLGSFKTCNVNKRSYDKDVEEIYGCLNIVIEILGEGYKYNE